MAGDEEGPLAGNFEQQLAAQRVAQEKLEQQLQRESQARVGMETTLSTMQQLLETLVRGQGTSSGPTTATTTATWTTTTSTDPSIYSGSAFQSNLNAAVHPNQPAMTSEETRSSSGGCANECVFCNLVYPDTIGGISTEYSLHKCSENCRGNEFCRLQTKGDCLEEISVRCHPRCQTGAYASR